MNDGKRALLGALLFLAGVLPTSRAAEGPVAGAPPCGPVCTGTVRHVCKLVPDTKKVRKIVYTTKEVPFCQRKCTLWGLFGRKCGCDNCGGGECLKCKGPYWRTILVKTEITVEEPTMKCVTENVIEPIPCAVPGAPPCQELRSTDVWYTPPSISAPKGSAVLGAPAALSGAIRPVPR